MIKNQGIISKVLSRPIRFSFITIFIALAVFLASSMILINLDQIVSSQNDARCLDVPNCFEIASTRMRIVHTIVYDFKQLAEYTVEITTLLVITQLIYRVVRRTKSSKYVH